MTTTVMSLLGVVIGIGFATWFYRTDIADLIQENNQLRRRVHPATRNGGAR